MIITVEAEKAFNKIHHSFLIKSQSNNRRKLPQPDKGYQKLQLTMYLMKDWMFSLQNQEQGKNARSYHFYSKL